MRKRKMVVSTISGEPRALVRGKGWKPLKKINPNEKVYFIQDAFGVWDNFKTDKNKSQKEQHKLLAKGYANGL